LILTKSIAQGKLHEKLNISGDDELVELYTSFNSMIDSLKKNIELEKELALSREHLKTEKLTTVGLLASRLAHDLRNPLSVIKNTIELLKMGLSKDMIKSDQVKFERLERAISRMSNQIDGVMDFVRIKPMKFEPTSITQIFKSTLQSLKIPENITINLPKNHVQFVCDVEQLEVVFTNLIFNAIQAIDKKGTITIRAEEKTDDIRIEVEDSGTGISDNIIREIFDPLFTTKQSGTGLGLPTCKSIVEQHGGTINIRNNPTTFIIIIPKKPVVELKDLIMQNSHSNSNLA